MFCMLLEQDFQGKTNPKMIKIDRYKTEIEEIEIVLTQILRTFRAMQLSIALHHKQKNDDRHDWSCYRVKTINKVNKHFSDSI